MSDVFSNHAAGLSSPASHAAAVTPNDSADLSTAARALYVGTAGNISLVTTGGDTVTLSNVAAGILPIRVARVRATGTTASNIVAIW